MAQQLSLEASSRGYFVSGPKCLNDAVDNLPLGQPVIIFTCSYEGEPPHNAARFVPWLESLPTSDQMKEVKYAVFGCGNAEWPQTFHRIPKLIDSAFSAAGAQRLVDLKLADAAHDDMFTVFENWQAEVSGQTKLIIFKALKFGLTDGYLIVVPVAGPWCAKSSSCCLIKFRHSRHLGLKTYSIDD